MNDKWTEANNALQKTFKWKDFKEALAFVDRVGAIAERLHHHPDICIKDYNKVLILTTTHDKDDRITEKDRELVRAIDGIGIS